MDHCGRVGAEEIGANCLIWHNYKNTSLATIVIWVSIEREAPRGTPKFLIVSASVRGTLSRGGSWSLGLGPPFLSYRTSVLDRFSFSLNHPTIASSPSATHDGTVSSWPSISRYSWFSSAYW